MNRTKSIRNAHFLGTKIRNLRKRNNLTMEDLSARCVKIDASAAPSVSHISMIERGKRYPSEDILDVIATVFQKDVDWFLTDVPEGQATVPDKGQRGGIDGMALEPRFLFSKEILQIAIPELLSQAGVSGRQFAHLLIRAHQENHQNRFPELERAAEGIGQRRMAPDIEALRTLLKQLGLTLHWFDSLSATQRATLGVAKDAFVRSYFEAPAAVHVNAALRTQPTRLKYDLATYIGHKVLHDGDGIKSVMVSQRSMGHGAYDSGLVSHEQHALTAQDMVHAWRDFECSFFAGALLCPKIPFRRFIEHHAHEISVSELIGVSRSVIMRRMTAVSSYSHWHYFDAYPPGELAAVYRGNGIPLPWGNMRLVQDPCQHWSVFRMLRSSQTGTSAQISLLDTGAETRIYCCESVNESNVAGVNRVLCVGIDINPAIEAQGHNARDVAASIKNTCLRQGGVAPIPRSTRIELARIARILNIGWLERGIDTGARVICPRSNACPRDPKCKATPHAD